VTGEARIEAVAHALTADVHAESDEVQEAFRYMLARVALDEGLLKLVSREERPAGVVRLVCQEPGTGTRYAVERPAAWTEDEEAAYVAEMRRCLLGDG
jgi:hypothetical protein